MDYGMSGCAVENANLFATKTASWDLNCDTTDCPEYKHSSVTCNCTKLPMKHVTEGHRTFNEICTSLRTNLTQFHGCDIFRETGHHLWKIFISSNIVLFVKTFELPLVLSNTFRCLLLQILRLSPTYHGVGLSLCRLTDKYAEKFCVRRTVL